MNLRIISGFLGSGKTTLMLQLVESAIRKGYRTAILVNEIGQIGIDDQYLKQHNLNVWQLLNGCICCSLGNDLNNTLSQLQNDYQPELVFLEPSGAANLEFVNNGLDNYAGPPFKSKKILSIIDPLRISGLIEAVTPLIE